MLNGWNYGDEGRKGMESRKTLFDYLGQTLVVFGFSTIVLDVLCLLVGEDAQSISTIYSLGKDGISVTTSLQIGRAHV